MKNIIIVLLFLTACGVNPKNGSEVWRGTPGDKAVVCGEFSRLQNYAICTMSGQAFLCFKSITYENIITSSEHQGIEIAHDTYTCTMACGMSLPSEKP